IMRRSVAGIRMAVKLPLTSFLGISLTACRRVGLSSECLSIRLEHRDPALCVPLFAGAQGLDVIAEWHLWARILGLPLLVADPDGPLREPFRRLGRMRIDSPRPRRRRRHAISARRPSLPLRRYCDPFAVAIKTYRGEREIIARS